MIKTKERTPTADMSPELLVQLGNALLKAGGQKEEKTVASGMTGAGLFGATGGIFSTAGLEPDVISAVYTPRGILAELDRFPSVLESPRFSSITGFTGTVGNEPALPCDNAPSGYMKSCELTAAFGRVARATNTIEWDQVMRKLHSGVNTDLMLRGKMLGMDLQPSGLSEADALNIVTMAEMVGAAAQIERTLTTMAWQGSPANNNVGGGYKEFPGLDNQIVTGQVDRATNQACPALDSDVKDFNYNDVTGTAPSIVEYLSMLEFYLRTNAIRMGLWPVEFKVAMREELWYVLSEIWPCQYNTNRCANAVTGGQVQLMGDAMTAERDRMRRAKTIDINGNTYEVITDDGIYEANNINDANLNAGQYASSIYMLPMTIVGNFPVLYMEHVDYRAGARDQALLRNKEDFWTDDGIFSWAIESEKWCYELTAKVEPRIVLRTPQLAGKIQNVRYEPLQHLRSFDPDSPYHQDGGVSLRATPTSYSVW